MRESFIETLLYLFENYVTKNVPFIDQPENVILEMMREGYNFRHIKKALNWLTLFDKKIFNLNLDLKIFGVSQTGIRIYAPEESQKLSPEAKGYLGYLEQLHIIDTATRELIIHCAMYFSDSLVGLPEIQCISLLVLHKYPEKCHELKMLEHLMLFGNYKEMKQ